MQSCGCGRKASLPGLCEERFEHPFLDPALLTASPSHYLQNLHCSSCPPMRCNTVAPYLGTSPTGLPRSLPWSSPTYLCFRQSQSPVPWALPTAPCQTRSLHCQPSHTVQSPRGCINELPCVPPSRFPPLGLLSPVLLHLTSSPCPGSPQPATTTGDVSLLVFPPPLLLRFLPCCNKGPPEHLAAGIHCT